MKLTYKRSINYNNMPVLKYDAMYTLLLGEEGHDFKGEESIFGHSFIERSESGLGLE
jgi:hypothetical protein